MSDFDRQVTELSRDDLAEIEQAYYDAVESDADSFGNHWILIGVLGRYGFRTNGTREAEQLADRIIIRWHTLR